MKVVINGENIQKKKNIKELDISVVVQGALKPETVIVLKSIRKFLSNAEIILSTWENSDISKFDGLYDKLILNKDPGAIIYDDAKNLYNNINRLLVSTRNGVNIAARKYVLKLRSDVVLKNGNILKFIDNFNVRNSKKSLFKNRIFAYEIFSIKYDEKKQIMQRMLFHISDWCYFGLKEDLQELFNIDNVIEPEFSRYFENHKKKVNDIHSSRLWKMSPEQYITSENAKKIFSNLNFENYLDINNKNISLSEDFIINNFIVYSSQKWGIYPLKEEYKNERMYTKNPFTFYSKIEQLKDYKKYCDNSIVLRNIKLLKKVCENRFYNSLTKHFFELVYCKSSRKFSELLSTLFYSYKYIVEVIRCSQK